MSDFKQFRIVSNGTSNTYLVKDEFARNSLQNKVDKISGKGLSTNDFSNADKEKLDSIAVNPSQNGEYILRKNADSVSYQPLEEADVIGDIEYKNEELKQGVVSSFLHRPASGDIVSFTDGANYAPLKSMICSIAPAQDLHGYNAPWPAGGGKNKLPNTASTETKNNVKFTVQSDTSIKVENAANANTVFVVGSTELAAGTYILSGITGGVDNDFYVQVVNETQTSQIAFSYNGDKQFTLSDTQVVVYRIFVRNGVDTNGKIIYPMIRLSSVADDTFFPYSNICPIVGYTGLTVYRTGKNLFGSTVEQGGMSASGKTTSTTRVRSADFLRVLGGGSYTISAQSAIAGKTIAASVGFYAGNTESDYSNRISVISFTAAPLSFTVPSNANFVVLTFAYSDNSDITPTGIKEIQLELGSTASDYQPYVGTTYQVSWQSEAGTIYEGTLDVLSGLLTVTMVGVDLGTLDWQAAGTNTTDVYRMRSTDISALVKKPASSTYLSSIICSNYKTVTASETYRMTQGVSLDQNGNIQLYDADYNTSTSVAAFKTAMSGVQLVYELATPVTYQITPQQVTTLLGLNNIWTDVGTIDLEYCQDPEVLEREVLAAYPTDTATGAIASFSDGADNVPMKDVVCKINPLQDLHGYDSPWPAGGSKNKLPENLFVGGTSGGITSSLNSNGTINISASSMQAAVRVDIGSVTLDAGTYTLTGGIKYSTSSGIELRLRTNISQGSSEIAVCNSRNTSVNFTLAETTTIYAVFIVLTSYAGVSGTYAPMIRLSSIADDTFFPYSNICPISGHTGLTVNKTGKNLFNPSQYEELDLTGNGTLRYGHSFAAGTYTIVNNYNETISYRMPKRDLSDRGTTAYISANSSATITVDSDRLLWVFVFTWSQGLAEKICVNIGTDIVYHAYTGTTYPISWETEAGTVYGGTLDVVSGLLTVTMASVDLGTLPFTKQEASQSGRFDAALAGKAIGETNIICSQYKTVSAAQMPTSDYCIRGASVNENIVIVDTAYSNASAADFKAAMSGVQLVYELATPVTYQLTPTEVDSLLGANNLWHDANGNISVEYRQSPEGLKSDVQEIESRVEVLESEVSDLNEKVLDAYVTDTATGAIASFSDGANDMPMKSVICTINPVQDLHGYDAPWPAGGGKNLLNITRDDVVTSNGITFTPVFNSDGALAYINVDGTASARSQFVQTSILSLKGGIEYVFSIGQNGDATGSKVTAFLSYLENGTAKYIDLASEESRIKAFTPVEDTTASFVLEVTAGYVGQQISNYKAFPMVRLSSVTDATFAPYSNECPISGFTGLTAYQTGKNLIDASTIASVNTGRGNTWVVNGDGSISTSGTATANSYAYITNNGSNFKLPSGIYTFSALKSDGTPLTDLNVLCGVWVNGTYTPFSGVITSGKITFNHDGNGNLQFALEVQSGKSPVGTVWVQIELNSSQTAYEPYQGNTVPASWQSSAGTVYGGTLDVVSGLLTVTMVSADAGDIGWTRYDLGDNWAFYHSFNDMARGAAGNAPDFLVSNYKAVESASRSAFLNSGADLTAVHVDNGKAIYIKDASISTAADFKTAMTGQTIVYTLETPVTYQLTAQEVDSLIGLNNVWCNTGNTTVNYRADTTLYINKKIAEVQALILENT